MQLQPHEDWSALIDEAVDNLVAELMDQPIRGWADAVVGPPGVESAVRERLVTFSTTLLAAAATGVGHLQCDDGISDPVDCDFIFRPNNDPYYRCRGHSPPHCYRADYATMPNCP